MQTHHPLYPTNWNVRFLCDCHKDDRAIDIHKGIAHEISTHSMHILSDHHICVEKKIAMQLLIPSLLNCAPQKVVKIIGNSISSMEMEGMFLTKIEFQYFEENGMKELERNLHKRFHPKYFSQTAQRTREC